MSPPEPPTPTLVGLYRDRICDGDLVGYEPVAWAVVLPSGQVVTMAATGPASVSLWHSLEDAQDVLDAYVAEIDPRRPPRDVMGSTP